MQNRIRQLRRKAGISQEKLAEMMNVTQASISLYETNSNIPSDMLVAISRYFGVSVDYLLCLDDRETDAALSSEEYQLILCYRELPLKYRKAVISAVKIMNGNSYL